MALGVGLGAGAGAFLLLRNSMAGERVLLLHLSHVFPREHGWALLAMGRLALKKQKKNGPSIGEISDELFGDARWQTATAETAPQLLREQIKEDFGAGRLRAAGKWMLSRTEFNLMALFRKKLAYRLHSDPPTALAWASAYDEYLEPRDTGAVGDPGKGKEIYEAHCSGCHQRDGRGLEGQTGANLREGAMDKTNAELSQIIEDGVQSDATSMPGFGDRLDNNDVRDLLAYMREKFEEKSSAKKERERREKRRKKRKKKKKKKMPTVKAPKQPPLKKGAGKSRPKPKRPK
jgi:mono/diheme cytochrome c family protein